MRLRLGVLPFGLVALFGAAGGQGCGSGSSGDDAGRGGAEATAGRGGAGMSSGGGSGATSGSGGSSGSIDVTTGGGAGVASGGSAGLDECAGDISKAELLPLDIVVMLDSSSSMLDDTQTAGTKWDAVSRALAAFVTDTASAGIGVGLQFFPLHDPAVPDTCDTDAECGSFGPCFQKFCQNAGPDFYPCANNQDCVANNDDFGPCAPLTYCWPPADPLELCHNATECPMAGDCVPFAECSGDTQYACNQVGQMCGQGLGTCQAFDPTSICIHTSSCSAAAYAAPAAEIAVLPGAAAGIRRAIDAQMPNGDTPTAPALDGAIQHAQAWADAHADHKVVVLLATDGLPTECIADPGTDPTGIDEVAGIAAAGLAGSPSIATFVIGVFAPTDMGAGANLDAIAVAGGSDSAFIVDTSLNVEQEFLAALDAIRGTRLPCEFQIPEPEAGKTLDYQQVNVRFTAGGSEQTLYYWDDKSACDATDGGWYYDVDPTQGKPTKIIACPKSCEALQGASDGTVEIVLGCTTVTVVK